MGETVWIQNPESVGKSIEEIAEMRSGQKINDLLNPPRNPFIANMQESIDLYKLHVKKGSNISVIADFDCDGGMSGVILHAGITEHTGREPEVIFPYRKAEGYGLSVKILDRMKNKDGLIITVDNGITAVDAIAEAKRRGYDVIVLDHHLMREDKKLPPAEVIVDPHVFPGEFNGYCGAGLALKFIEGITAKKTLLKKMRVFAGIATVADVMSLIGDNRNIVRDSMEFINAGIVTTGMKVLLAELKLSDVTEDDYGYKLGPIFNAAGRLEDIGPEKVFNLIRVDIKKSDPDYDEATLKAKAKELVRLNTARQAYAEANENTARMIAETESYRTRHKAGVFWDESFLVGINGITAGRMAEYLHMPCFVFSDTEDAGICKGSGRSYGNIHLKNLLDSVPDGILEGYGGHAGAAGLAAKRTKLESFQFSLDELLKDTVPDTDVNVRYYDYEIRADQVPEFTRRIRLLAPYGEGNPPITFKVTGFELSPKNGSFSREMGKDNQHIKLYGRACDAICFGMTQAYKNAGSPIKLELLGSLSENHWRNQTYYQVEAIDFHPIKIVFETKSYQSLADLLDFD